MAKIAMPLGQDFEDDEFKIPYDRLRAAHHEVVVIGSQLGETLQGKNRKIIATVQCTPDQVEPDQFDALVIAGGYSPDHLRINPLMVDFVRRFAALERPLAAICHGPQLLIEADLVANRKITSWPSVRTDLQNAGAVWVDKAVCIDGTLISSRKPDDLEEFSQAVLQHLAPSSRIGLDDTWIT